MSGARGRDASRPKGKGNRRQDQAVIALLENPTMDKAAAALGVSGVTLWRWMQDPGFQAVYREARWRAFRQSIARLQQASSAAVSTLLKIMIDPNAPAASRVRAAGEVLDHAAKAIELDDIEARVSDLERTTEAQER